MKLGDKVRVVKDMPSINGMLHEGTMVKIDYISNTPKHTLRVKDNLGKIWFLNEDDVVDV